MQDRKRGVAVYIVGVVLTLGAAAGAGYFVYNHSIQVAAARGVLQAEVDRGPRVEVVTVKAGPQSREITLLGDARPYTTTTLFAKVSGYVKSIRVDKGDKVEAGQVLAEIDSAETDSLYAGALADLDNKQRLVMRARQLLSRGDVAQQAAELAETNLRMAQEAVNNLATMKSYQAIRAPFAGTVTGRFADPGALLQAATTNQSSALPVLMISDNSRLRIGAYVEQRDVAAVHIGDPAEVVDAANAEARVMAKVSRTAGTLDPRTRTLYIEIDVDNRDGFLIPGSFAYVTLKLPVKSLPQVPVAALVQRNANQLVAVVGADGAIRFRPIKVASTDGISINVADGVVSGDRVAINVPNDVVEGTRIRPVLAASR